MRRNWHILTGLIIFFIAGYIGYIIAQWRRHVELTELVVSLILFLGACYVWLVNSLSVQTTLDVLRVARLEHENITDPLMGIYNRRYLGQRIEEEFERAHRERLSLSVLLVDVDNFKHVNDTYGHQGGDFALNRLGKLLMESVRIGDIVARYGGDEIFIIATNTAGSAAAELAERLRQIVESSLLLPQDGDDTREPMHVTVSIGVTTICRDIDTPRALVEHVDKALYRAKQSGRNRVVVSDCAAGSVPFARPVSG
jgi:diguanylate cyclase (GGDEF)-like protein